MFSKVLAICAVCAFAFVAAAPALRAADAPTGTGTIKGKVLDAQGHGVSNTTVQLFHHEKAKKKNGADQAAVIPLKKGGDAAADKGEAKRGHPVATATSNEKGEFTF